MATNHVCDLCRELMLTVPAVWRVANDDERWWLCDSHAAVAVINGLIVRSRDRVMTLGMAQEIRRSHEL